MPEILSTPPGSAPLPIALDHLVVAATTLDVGEAWLRERLGTPLIPGGTHVGFGTHNRLLGLGPDCYLELIAADPTEPGPPVLFGLGERAVSDALQAGPLLLHAVFRVLAPATLESVVARLDYDPGVITTMRRGDLAWRITIPRNAASRPAGWLPTLIDWGDTPHPSTRLPDSGWRAEALRFAGPSFWISRFPRPAAIHPNGADQCIGLGWSVEAGSTIEAVLRKHESPQTRVVMMSAVPGALSTGEHDPAT